MSIYPLTDQWANQWATADCPRCHDCQDCQDWLSQWVTAACLLTWVTSLQQKFCYSPSCLVKKIGRNEFCTAVLSLSTDFLLWYPSGITFAKWLQYKASVLDVTVIVMLWKRERGEKKVSVIFFFIIYWEILLFFECSLKTLNLTPERFNLKVTFHIKGQPWPRD